MKSYVSMLWQIMGITAKGYKRYSLRNTGIGTDRRNDKLKAVESLDDKGKTVIEYVEFNRPESKFERACRLETVGMRGR